VIKGKYTKKPVDYKELRAFLFTPHLYDRVLYGTAGCGATALALLTGNHPWDIQDQNKRKAHYSDRFMIKYLNDHQFKTIPLSQKGLNSNTVVTYPVSSDHVLLVSQLMAKREATWVIYHRNLSYHNFETGATDKLDFLNKPILTAYIVWSLKFSATRKLSGTKSKIKLL